jgi:hypothetical protein
VYFRVEKLVRPETGELIGALVPRWSADRDQLRERKFVTGAELRAEIKRKRNPKFYRLAHALGKLLVDQTEAFADLNSHTAIKRLQTESRVCCDRVEYDVPGVGTITRVEPWSTGFDDMEEGTWAELWTALVKQAEKYLPGMNADAIEEFIKMTVDSEL